MLSTVRSTLIGKAWVSADVGKVCSQNAVGSRELVLPGKVAPPETHNHIHNRETLRAFWDKGRNQGPLSASLSLPQMATSGLFLRLQLKQQGHTRAGLSLSIPEELWPSCLSFLPFLLAPWFFPTLWTWLSSLCAVRKNLNIKTGCKLQEPLFPSWE